MPAPTENYDIVIIGAGPVGLLLSVCLARWGYKIKHIDNRSVAILMSTVLLTTTVDLEC